MHDTMDELMKLATASRYRHAGAETSFGKVEVTIVPKQGRAIQGRALKPMVVWKLNGTRTKSATLDALFQNTVQP